MGTNGRVDVWRLTLDTAPQRALALLNAEERQTAARFGQEILANRWMVGRAALRGILSGYVDMEATDIALAFNANGKPFLARQPDDRPPVHFNLSHSEQVMLVAVTDRRVGIDVEKMRSLGNPASLALQFFSPVEVDSLNALPEDERERAFFRGWCCKEAYVKGRGDGILDNLDSFTVEVRPDSPPALLAAEEDNRWTLFDLPADPGYCAALAVEADCPGFVLRDWEG